MKLNFKKGFPGSRFWRRVLPVIRLWRITTPKFTTGFTLLEILISLSLIVVLAGLVFYSISGFRNKEALDTESRQISSILEEARSLTLSGQGGNAYGVRLQGDQIIRFVGTSFASGTASNITYTLNPAVKLNNVSLQGGGSDVVFDKLRGTTANYGTMILNLVSTTSSKKTITINSTGIIDVQ